MTTIATIQHRAQQRKALKDCPQGGYFMSVVNRATPVCPQGFPPRFVSQWTRERGQQDALTKIEVRERCAAECIGWANGTLSQAGTPVANRRPELLKGRRT